MNASNCPRCGRLFTSIRSNVCPNCEKAEEETFQLLKAYIGEYPMCTLAELHEATNVPLKRITQFIRDGRLEISKGMVGEIVCDKCGKPIARGRYCETCALAITQNVNEMFSSLDKKDSGQKMHTLGRSKKL